MARLELGEVCALADDGAAAVLDPFAHWFHEDPYPTYDALRASDPVHHNEALGFYALSRYDDVLKGLRDFKGLSSAGGTVLELMDMGVDFADAFAEEPMIEFLDPPYQQQLRRLVSAGFTPRRIAAMEGEIRAVAARVVDALVARGEGDLVDDFAAPVPLDVISDMIGVPVEDRWRIRRWIELSLARVPEPPYITKRALVATSNLAAYHRSLVAAHRGQDGDDLIHRLMAARIDDGTTRALTQGEISGFIGLLGGAGTETVSKLLTSALVLLQRHPDVRAAVAADPGLLAAVVEESLRFWSPNQYSARTATTDIELHGVTIPAGARVLLLMGSANRDEQRFAHADQFDVARPGNDDHVALGAGVHFCLGASLTRLEARVALEEFLLRCPHYEIDEDGMERVHNSNVHGFKHVPVKVGH